MPNILNIKKSGNLNVFLSFIFTEVNNNDERTLCSWIIKSSGSGSRSNVQRPDNYRVDLVDFDRIFMDRLSRAFRVGRASHSGMVCLQLCQG